MRDDSIARLIRLILLAALIFSGNAFAQNSAVEGMIKDPNGRPIAGADVRFEAKTRSASSKHVQSDRRGHYSVEGLTSNATYRVSLLVNGSIKASIKNVLAKQGSTQLNFDLRTSSIVANSEITKNGKHYVYVPEETGTHLGGRWVEVDENGHADSVGVNNVEKANGEALRRIQSNSGTIGGMGAGGH